MNVTMALPWHGRLAQTGNTSSYQLRQGLPFVSNQTPMNGMLHASAHTILALRFFIIVQLASLYAHTHNTQCMIHNTQCQCSRCFDIFPCTLSCNNSTADRCHHCADRSVTLSTLVQSSSHLWKFDAGRTLNFCLVITPAIIVIVRTRCCTGQNYAGHCFIQCIGIGTWAIIN